VGEDRRSTASTLTEENGIPDAAAFRIQLPTFEGPLDLLLHLIKKHELDILDLPISFVTERYLEYLGMMQELDLDIASEYLLMAATLAHIKSKMLLPPSPFDEVEEAEAEFQGDPRAELIKRLLEYQKYREAADKLGARPLEGRDVFVRGMPAPEAEGPAPLASIDLYKLLDAFQSILKRVKGRIALEITPERITIQERITQLADLLRERRGCTFEELFAGDRTRYEVVVTFLALLEMTKMRMTRVYQADPNSPLHVHYALLEADAPTIPPEAITAAADPVAEPEPEAEAELEAVPEAATEPEPEAEPEAESASNDDEAATTEVNPEPEQP
jgi:segregation and condensation protein A